MGAQNSVHSSKWHGTQSRYIRQYVKLARRGAPPIDFKKLEQILAEDAAKRQAAKKEAGNG